jgi:hypothetical protein
MTYLRTIIRVLSTSKVYKSESAATVLILKANNINFSIENESERKRVWKLNQKNLFTFLPMKNEAKKVKNEKVNLGWGNNIKDKMCKNRKIITSKIWIEICAL